MQALLTIGERSITAALHGGNASAAKLLLTSLMQSDLVAPLLVSGSSARSSAHVQECLLRLQLQKLRHQVTVSPSGHSTDSTNLPDSSVVNPDLPLHDSGLSNADAVSALPADLLDVMMAPSSMYGRTEQHGGIKQVHGVHSSGSASTPFAVASTGLRPLSIPEALEELFASLSHCLQPHGPLMPAIHASAHPGSEILPPMMHAYHGYAAPRPQIAASAHSALASCAQQLFSWTMHTASHNPRWKPPWTPHLLEILRQDCMMALVHRQLIGLSPDESATGSSSNSNSKSTVGLRKFLATPVGSCTPTLACMVAAAVSSGRELQHAWLKFGDLVYARVRQERHSRGGHAVRSGLDALRSASDGVGQGGPISPDKVRVISCI